MLQFDPTAHRYTRHGVEVPSVTQIIQAAGLGVDYGLIPPDVLEHARQRGKAVHAACEYIDQDDLDRDSIDPQLAPYVAAYDAFRRDTGFEVVSTEQRLMHPEGWYAGTPDVWGWIGANRVEIDRKAVASLDLPSVSLQMAGYAPLIAATDPRWRNARRYALQLCANGTYRFRPANMPMADETFRSALRVVRGEATDRDATIITDWRRRHGGSNTEA